MNSKIGIPEKTVERLLIYETTLVKLKNKGIEYIYSHELADITNSSSAQVRRDLMSIEFSADKKKGYNINELVNTIVTELQLIQEINMCIIGAGKLGHAIINYFKDSDTRFNIKAVFDKDLKQKKELGNCCNMASIDNLEAVIKEKKNNICDINSSSK